MGTLLAREKNRITSTRTLRRAGTSLACIGLLAVARIAWADTNSYETDSSQAPNVGPSWVSHPVLPATNAVDSSFLQNHAELAQPLQPPPRVPSPEETAAAEAAPDRPVALAYTQFSDPAGRPDDLPGHLLVVYNTLDPDSKSLAEYYASRRNIPAVRVLGLPCSITEEISRRQFEETLRLPILNYICEKDWMTRRSEGIQYGSHRYDALVATSNEIWAIVLMRGVPLKIANDPDRFDRLEPEAALESNAAAVDSELATLPIYGLPIGGFMPNPFFDKNMSGQIRVGPELATKIILVTRLDGPKPSDVRRMIDDCIEAGQKRLSGLAVIDSRGNTNPGDGYFIGDVWLRSARDLLVRKGWSVKFDDRLETLPDTDPCNQVALYLGWYTTTADGPWVTPPDRFSMGAIAYHLHSFSASTVRSQTDNWVGPLITHGADATMGTVYEPYLALTPHLDVFTKRLLDGDSFAEAAYASQPGLSWMTTVVGDPLYRPFAVLPSAALAQPATPRLPHNDWLLLQLVQQALAANRIPGDRISLEKYLDVPGAGAVAQEGLGDLLEKLDDPEASLDAEKAYKKAMRLDPVPVDRIRLGLKLARHFSNRGHDQLAGDMLKQLWDLYPDDAQRFGVPGGPPVSATRANLPVSMPPPPAPPGPPRPPHP